MLSIKGTNTVNSAFTSVVVSFMLSFVGFRGADVVLLYDALSLLLLFPCCACFLFKFKSFRNAVLISCVFCSSFLSGSSLLACDRCGAHDEPLEAAMMFCASRCHSLNNSNCKKLKVEIGRQASTSSCVNALRVRYQAAECTREVISAARLLAVERLSAQCGCMLLQGRLSI